MLPRSLPRPFFVLAPMDDVTDMVFRQVIDRLAPADLYVTEFVNVDGLQSPGRSALLKKLRFNPTENRLVAQLWGKNPDNFMAVAQQIANGSLAAELGLPAGCNFVGIDLNMGCPAKTEVKNGTCSALMQHRPLASAIITATQSGAAGLLPVSVKTRLGWNDVDPTWTAFLLGHKLAMLTVHTRTKKEMSKVPAHWQDMVYIREQRNELSPNTLLVGNGDVMSREQGVMLARQYGLDGVMVGRGVFHDPYLFANQSPWSHATPQQKIALYALHVDMFAETWQHAERPIHTLNKFCKIYLRGFDSAKEIREQLMAAPDVDTIRAVLTTAQQNIAHTAKERV